MIIKMANSPPGLSLHPPLSKLVVDPGPVEAGGEPLHLQGAHLGTRTSQVTLAIVTILSMSFLLCTVLRHSQYFLCM